MNGRVKNEFKEMLYDCNQLWCLLISLAEFQNSKNFRHKRKKLI